MTDLVGAFEKAVYDRLCSKIRTARVFQHVPERQAPPVVIVGDVDWEDEGEKDGPLLRITVQIVSIVAGASRKPLSALQASVRDAIDRWTPAATGSVLFGELRVTSSSGQEVQGDHGPIYFGQQSATAWVQAAD